MPSMPVSAEAAALIGIAGTLIGAAGKWALDQVDYRAKRGDRVRERTYPDRAKAYIDLVWVVDSVVTKPQAERRRCSTSTRPIRMASASCRANSAGLS